MIAQTGDLRKKTSSQSWQDLRRDHGSPVSRQRIFIILVKSDLMENDCKDKLGDIFLEIKALLACTADVGWLLGWSLLRCLSKQNLVTDGFSCRLKPVGWCVGGIEERNKRDLIHPSMHTGNPKTPSWHVWRKNCATPTNGHQSATNHSSVGPGLC